jgi:hypothetical protein
VSERRRSSWAVSVHGGKEGSRPWSNQGAPGVLADLKAPGVPGAAQTKRSGAVVTHG